MAIIRSALRYADSAIAGMPSAPGVLTTAVGGGADAKAAATWKPIFGCWTAITSGPDGSVEAGVTAATGVIAASRSVDLGPGKGGAAAPTTPPKIRQAIIATPNAGLRAVRVINCCTAATVATTAAGIRVARAARTADCRAVVKVLTRAAGIFGGRGLRIIRCRIFARAKAPPIRTRPSSIFEPYKALVKPLWAS